MEINDFLPTIRHLLIFDIIRGTFRGEKALIEGKKVLEVANQVEKRRIELGMSQEELARASRVSRQTISDIETGRHIPRLDTALMIASALLTTVDALFQIVT